MSTKKNARTLPNWLHTWYQCTRRKNWRNRTNGCKYNQRPIRSSDDQPMRIEKKSICSKWSLCHMISSFMKFPKTHKINSNHYFLCWPAYQPTLKWFHTMTSSSASRDFYQPVKIPHFCRSVENIFTLVKKWFWILSLNGVISNFISIVTWKLTWFDP